MEIKPETKQDIKRIIRIMSTDIDGNLSVERALRKVKGVSFMFSRAVCTSTGVDRKRKVGTLSDNERKGLENFISNPSLPAWMLNRRKDPETGKDMHITMADLSLRKREDINQMKRMHCYKGVRHELGQPVRGQSTRSTFRTQKSVGVSKKKAQAAPAKPKTAEKK
ncbi:30S ribosomal protein S13 [archaeon]|nr:30S ribosomal protein S13 [archaeon]